MNENDECLCHGDFLGAYQPQELSGCLLDRIRGLGDRCEAGSLGAAAPSSIVVPKYSEEVRS